MATDQDTPVTASGAASPTVGASQRDLGAPTLLHQPSASAFWHRVKEHKVVQWTIAYGAAAYTLLHVVEMVSDALDWPHLVVRIVTLSLILGAPVAATLAWYHGHRALHRVSGPELAILTLLLLISGTILWFLGRPRYERASVAPHAETQSSELKPLHAGEPPDRSIAVLPFVDMSEKHDQEYFADGMTEEVSDLLVRVPELRVIGRTSSFQFKGKDEDLRKVGAVLGAAYIVEGSVRKAGQKLRVTAQLIEARSGTRLWAESYDRDFGDILILQSDIGNSIARVLQLAAIVDDRGPAHRLKTPDSYAYYLRGRDALDRGDLEANREAVTAFEQSLALDPSFARAQEALCLAYFLTLDTPSQVGWPDILAAADATLRLDPQSAFAQLMRAMYHATYEYNWRVAGAELDHVLAMKPGDPLALYLSAWLAFDLGRHAEAVRLQAASLALDPLNPESYNNAGWIDYLMGNLDAAEHAFRESIRVSASYPDNHWMLGQILLLRGQPQAALREMEAETDARDAGLTLAYHALRRDAESKAALDRVTAAMGSMVPSLIAVLHAYRGERAEALDWLEKAVATRDINVVHRIKDDPMLAPVRDEARYRTILRKMNLQD